MKRCYNLRCSGGNPLENRNREKQNKLGTMPVGKLLVSMAVPMMLSFFIQALYNIVDSMFVARISENALTAVSLAFPMQQIMNAIGIGTGVGISACIPRAIARNKKEHADSLACTGVFLCLVYCAVFILLGVTFTHKFYTIQTDIPEIVESGTKYLSIVWIICAGAFFGNFFEKMLTATGNAAQAMIAQAGGAVFNIIFDPLLIFGIGPFPKMGISGAALATVMGQVLAAGLACMFNLKKNEWIRFSVQGVMHPSFSSAKEIYSIGFPSMITMGLSSMSSFFINQILLSYSTTAAAVYGIWLKLQNFCFMPAFGMNNGMVPILSYNYGAGRFDRVFGTIRYALCTILALMAVLTCVFELNPHTLLNMFNASETLMGIGLTAIRTCVIALVFGGACVILTSAMQALNHARYTLAVNVLRGFALPVISFRLLSALFHDLNRLWIAVPLADFTACIISVFLYLKMKKDLSAGH
ncbi:MAG: MATE family efflux transporter [Erysipelotrichaceae bacterium]|nr:MATE family efflux transporter [Erysipelotrichaceae bacterium]